MRYRGHDVPRCGVTEAHRAKHLVVVARRVQRRWAGHPCIGALRRLPERAVLDSVLVSVAVPVSRRPLAHRPCRHRTCNALALGGGLNVSAEHRRALAHIKVTHRGLRADGVRVEQTAEQQAQSQDTPQSR
ncbi:hypothetical protein GCM10011579_066320 [Streptomyces albiflavescens]|uniref:Uncharacterized protein n=1 Tax=Streptomyces albiflavescens TaxID=1623582 RepID=A0A917YBI9_9ACTN|nr:hypothetical protein GCM10011579_066320 [Streptomyces albiflavescens]